MQTSREHWLLDAMPKKARVETISEGKGTHCTGPDLEALLQV